MCFTLNKKASLKNVCTSFNISLNEVFLNQRQMVSHLGDVVYDIVAVDKTTIFSNC